MLLRPAMFATRCDKHVSKCHAATHCIIRQHVCRTETRCSVSILDHSSKDIHMCHHSRGYDKRGISRYQAQLVMCMHSSTAVCCQPRGVQSLWKGTPRYRHPAISSHRSVAGSAQKYIYWYLFLHHLFLPYVCSRACRRKTSVFTWLAGAPLCAHLPAKRPSRCSWGIRGLENSFCVCARLMYSTIKILMVDSIRHTLIRVIRFVNIKILVFTNIWYTHTHTHAINFWNPVRNRDLYAWHSGWFEDEMSCLLLHTFFNCSICWCDMPTCLQASSNICVCVCVCERERETECVWDSECVGVCVSLLQYLSEYGSNNGKRQNRGKRKTIGAMS